MSLPNEKKLPGVERRFSACQATVETRENEKPKIVGQAAVFYDGTPATEYELWPGVFERVMPTAFDRAIREDDVRALFNHVPSNILGRTTAGTLALAKSEKGLQYDISPPESSVGQTALEAVRRRDVTGSSFSFSVIEETWRKEDEGKREIREISEVKLFDVGPVTFPAYEQTTAGVRAWDGADEARESYERWKRDLELRDLQRKIFEYSMRARLMEMETAK